MRIQETVNRKRFTVFSLLKNGKEDTWKKKKEITKESGRHRNDGNDDNRLFTRGTNYQCGRP